MNFFSIIQAAGLSFFILLAVFTLMEKAFPANAQQHIFRPAWALDLCFFLGQYFLWGALVLLILNYFNHWLSTIIPHAFRQKVASQPWLLQAFEVVVLSDFTIYWAHRLQHSTSFLWRFHKVHHSTEHLDWLAAHREHPVDTIYTVGLLNLPALILGFPLETLAGLIAFRGMWAIYIHSNVRLPIGPLKWLIGAPELHNWHHDLDRKAGNYANVSPLMDIIFGTYKCPDKEPEHYGIDERLPNNYIAHMLYPMLPDKWVRMIERRLGGLRGLAQIKRVNKRANIDEKVLVTMSDD